MVGSVHQCKEGNQDSAFSLVMRLLKAQSELFWPVSLQVSCPLQATPAGSSSWVALGGRCVGRVAERSLSWMGVAEVFSRPLPSASERCVTCS